MDAPEPRVWLNYSQQELDDAYDQQKHASNIPQVQARRREANARSRQSHGSPRRLRYGPTGMETIDLYLCGRGAAPTNLYVHGGAWRNNTAADYAFLSDLYLGLGANCAFIDFDNVVETGGSLLVMHEQIERAIAWLWRHAAELGLDADSFYLTGQSSGAHLAACALCNSLRREEVPQDLFKGAMLISGMYELLPVSLSKRASYVNFDAQTIERLSPLRHLASLHTPLVMAYGTEESPEFIRQSQEFHQAVLAAGKPATLDVAAGYNHFEMVEGLWNPHGNLGRLMAQQMFPQTTAFLPAAGAASSPRA
ncbi:MAG: alpha/beta hydrolase [Pseudomonadota bacterium]